MYDELVKRVRRVADEVCEDYNVDPYNAEQRCLAILQAADAIEELSKKKDCPYWFEDGGFCNMLGKCIVEPTKEKT